MTLILVCIFGISPGNPGVVKLHALKTAERARIERFEARMDDSADDSLARAYEVERRMLYSRICRQSFGQSPDLVYIESTRK